LEISPLAYRALAICARAQLKTSIKRVIIDPYALLRDWQIKNIKTSKHGLLNKKQALEVLNKQFENNLWSASTLIKIWNPKIKKENVDSELIEAIRNLLKVFIKKIDAEPEDIDDLRLGIEIFFDMSSGLELLLKPYWFEPHLREYIYEELRDKHVKAYKKIIRCAKNIKNYD
jgi:hypothetical protein